MILPSLGPRLPQRNDRKDGKESRADYSSQQLEWLLLVLVKGRSLEDEQAERKYCSESVDDDNITSM
jgi:hypothetical protein